MSKPRYLTLLATGFLLATTARASGPSEGPPTPPDAAASTLALALRTILLHAVPDPLYEKSKGWDQTKHVPTGIKWSGKVLPLRPKVVKGEKNDGTWRKVRVTAFNL